MIVTAELYITTDVGRRFKYVNNIIIPIRQPQDPESEIITIKRGIKLNLEKFIDVQENANLAKRGEIK